MANLELTGPQFRPLSKAIITRFDLGDFDQMLKMRLDINRQNISVANSYRAIVFAVIDDANRKGYVHKLVDAARKERPAETTFVEYAQMLGTGVRVQGVGEKPIPTKGELESLINKLNMPIDVSVLLERLGEIEGRVCRIDFGSSGVGTGFLVGPAAVLTNHHVIAPALEDPTRLPHFKCRFDYKVNGAGTEINSGMIVKIKRIVHASRHDPADISRDGVPDPENLDYALLELEDAIGTDPIGDNASISAEERGWIKVPADAHHFLKNSPLFIVQHPAGQPIKVALDGDAIIGLNDNHTRVEYTTNTENGSSGSPCFGADWQLVALHHAGDPGWLPTWNAGVPIHLIRQQLESKGHAGMLQA